jgi:hypothetical protein
MTNNSAVTAVTNRGVTNSMPEASARSKDANTDLSTPRSCGQITTPVETLSRQRAA